MASMEKNRAELRAHLDDGETVEASVAGAYEMEILGKDSARNGILVATNNRVVFYAKKMLGYDMEVFPYSNISSIEMSKGMMGHKVSFFTSGNKVVMKWIKKGEVDKLIGIVKSRIGKKEFTPKADDKSSLYDDIERLGELKDKGILTEEEFEAKKKELLSKI